MEYRIHSRTNLKISSLGINTYNWKYFKEDEKQEKINSILTTALENQINTFQLYSESLENFFNWFNKTKIKSEIQISLSIPFETNFCSKVEKIFKNYSISKVDFLSFFNGKSNYANENISLKELKLLEKRKLTKYIGIYCQYISDAILLAKSKLIDYLIVNFSLLNTPDLLKTLFNICEINNISIFCAESFAGGILTSNVISDKFLESYKNRYVKSTLSELTSVGKEKMSHQLQIFSKEIGLNLQHICLRYLLDKDITSILMGVDSPEQVIDNLNALSIPPLSHKCLLDIQKITDFEKYFDSPKRRRISSD